MNGYDLSRSWFDFCFENPDLIKPIHSAIYFFAIEHCNRLGWKTKFGFPSQMVMESIGVKNWRTYSKALNELVSFGFIKMIEVSKNQYSSNIIAIVNITKANTKALDKALSKHSTKHSQSTVSIDKQRTIKQETKNKYAEFVSLTDKEYNKLISDHGQINTNILIETLDNYKGSNGKKYKSDYRAILNWVLDKTIKENKYRSKTKLSI